MLYELLAADDGLFRLFNYTTFRTGGAIVTAFLFSVLTGDWVILQNTHLGMGYLFELEQTLVKLEEIHEDFRVFITCEPTFDTCRALRISELDNPLR